MSKDRERADEDFCQKCTLLFELYERTPKTDRDYWIMTEMFVMVHGADVCQKAVKH